jgi:hypothetical protein
MPGRCDCCDVAYELRAEVERLRAALQAIICDSHNAKRVDFLARKALDRDKEC